MPLGFCIGLMPPAKLSLGLVGKTFENAGEISAVAEAGLFSGVFSPPLSAPSPSRRHRSTIASRLPACRDAR